MPLSESGIGLSGGQLQRLAIARAVAGRTRLLLMDEATSHLDANTEERVVENLDGLGCTRIVIAHRLSTIRNADNVIFLKSGTVCASGTHDELMNVSEYQEMFDKQNEWGAVR